MNKNIFISGTIGGLVVGAISFLSALFNFESYIYPIYYLFFATPFWFFEKISPGFSDQVLYSIVSMRLNALSYYMAIWVLFTALADIIIGILISYIIYTIFDRNNKKT